MWIRSLLVALLCLTFACGDDDGGSDASTKEDVGEDATTQPDMTVALGCGDLEEDEAQCMDGFRYVCRRDRLRKRRCQSGRTCQDGDDTCTCANVGSEPDGVCPSGCTEDPDCDVCTPDCTGKACGDNGCNGVCGECQDDASCSGGFCKPDTSCDDGIMNGDEKGVDCGGSCVDCQPISCTLNYNVDCPDEERCECDLDTGKCLCAVGPRGTKALGESCTTQNECATALCLNDRCSRICDSGSDCEAPLAECQPILGYCVEGQCTPECGGNECGDDGCGGSCGSCNGAQECVSGTCETPVGDGFDCYNGTQCRVGESCCISQFGGLEACFELGSSKDTVCKDDGTYIYIGCREDDDCAGSSVCCSDGFQTACATECVSPTTAVCDANANPGDNVCGSNFSCCEIQRPIEEQQSVDGIGRCFPLSCPRG